MEDLWAFNEEVVARAIYRSEIPVISAVGHEVDISISDLVADLRVPTPTAAGEAVVPRYELLKNTLDEIKARIVLALQNFISYHQARLEGLKNSPVFRRPQELVLNLERKVDELSTRLSRPVPEFLERWKERLEEKKIRLFQTASKDLRFVRERLQAISGTLDALSPLKIMERGYSITLDGGEKPIKELSDLEIGSPLKTLCKGGEIISKIEKIEYTTKGEESKNG